MARTSLFEGGNSIVVNTGTANFNADHYTGSLLDGGYGSLFVTETGATTSVTLNGRRAAWAPPPISRPIPTR